MKNKITACLVISTLLFSVFQIGESQAKGENAKAVIQHMGTGTMFELQTKQKNIDLGRGKYLSEFVTTIPKDFFTDDIESATASLSKHDEALDSSYAVRVTMYMYFDRWTAYGSTWASVDRYETKWTTSDSTLQLSSAYILHGCLGDRWSGANCFLGTWEQGTIGTPNLNVWYISYPSWRNDGVRLGYNAGSAHVSITRGGSTWNLEVCVYEGSCG